MAEEPSTDKENSAVEQKEEDTKTSSPTLVQPQSSVISAKSVTPSASKAMTPTPSKPDTPSTPKSAATGTKSRPSSSPKLGAKTTSAKSLKSKKSASGKSTAGSATGRQKRPKSQMSSGKKTPQPDEKKKKPTGKKALPPPPGVMPVGCKPIFMASQSQSIFHCVTDEDVTEDDPYILIPKEDIMKDFFNRAAISDFHPFKQIITDYPSDEILLIYDPDYKHGQNFLIATTEESKQALLHQDGVSEESDEETREAGAGDADVEEEDTTVYQYVPPVSKPWVTQGSEAQVGDESIVQQRKRINMTVRRRRTNFGAPVSFRDRNVGDAKDGIIDCLSYEDKTYALRKLELSVGTQAIASFTDTACQTDWRYPRNATTQYEPREFTPDEKDAVTQRSSLRDFVVGALPRFELAMQQNEIMNVFYDDWVALASEDSSFGSKADSHLKEYQSFTDLQFSKDKSITCIEWHPVIRGIVAVSVAERLTFDERVDFAQQIIMTPSLILIWSFTDPIHPQLLLEAPDDINCFKFCPTDPNIIAAGCVNGQVVMWDIAAHAARLKTQRGNNKRKVTTSLPGFEDDSALETPVVRYCAVSSIEHSHRTAITDLQWLPDHMEVNRMGVVQENKTGQCCQIITAATDHSVLFWDTRSTKAPNQSTQAQDKKNQDEFVNPIGVATTFLHLDLTWKPMLKVNLPKSEPGGDHSPVKFTIYERQGDRSVLTKAAEERREGTGVSGGFGMKPGSGKNTLTSVKTHFYIGTEDGEIVYVDWMPQKDQDSGKIQTPKPDWYHTVHSGPIDSLHRSPFFRDIILCVGGWTLSIWKEGVSSGPLLMSAACTKHLTGAFWSPTRPAVFYVTKQDGTVDVWDLLDRTHEASMTQSVSPAAITSIYPYQMTSKQHFLAVGDALGTLHILEIPWSLRQPTANELNGMSNYFERELNRRQYVEGRWDFREKEKMAHEIETNKKAGIAPNVTLTEEEQNLRLMQDYAAFEVGEETFLKTLGLLAEEPLPQID